MLGIYYKPRKELKFNANAQNLMSDTRTSALNSQSKAAIALLESLIACRSFSKEEQGTADLIAQHLQSAGVEVHRHGHNVWATSKNPDPSKPNLLLNSHHDTVKPHAQWTSDPFQPLWEEDRLIGLGANDAGASLVCLIQSFLAFYDAKELAFNLVLAASAEEEISGPNGIESLLKQADFPRIDCAIVGEPTQMQVAQAEKGLLVIDALVKGKAGHAAREEGINAIALAMEDIQFLHQQPFERVSPLLGPMKCSVTIIQAGSQHNVVPDECRYTIDCRVNDCYRLEEVMAFLQDKLHAELIPRSLRLPSSHIEDTHALIQTAKALALPCFGSPTLSDQALMPFPSIKMGPGHSGRSHTAGEYILASEIEAGLMGYQTFLTTLNTLI